MTVFTLSYGTESSATCAAFPSLPAGRRLRLRAHDPDLSLARRSFRSPRSAGLRQPPHHCVRPVLRLLFRAGAPGYVIAFLTLGLGLMGVVYGPLGTVLSELFPRACATPAPHSRSTSRASSAPRSLHTRRRGSRSNYGLAVRRLLSVAVHAVLAGGAVALTRDQRRRLVARRRRR